MFFCKSCIFFFTFLLKKLFSSCLKFNSSNTIFWKHFFRISFPILFLFWLFLIVNLHVYLLHYFIFSTRIWTSFICGKRFLFSFLFFLKSLSHMNLHLRVFFLLYRVKKNFYIKKNTFLEIAFFVLKCSSLKLYTGYLLLSLSNSYFPNL